MDAYHDHRSAFPDSNTTKGVMWRPVAAPGDAATSGATARARRAVRGAAATRRRTAAANSCAKFDTPGYIMGVGGTPRHVLYSTRKRAQAILAKGLTESEVKFSIFGK